MFEEDDLAFIKTIKNVEWFSPNIKQGFTQNTVKKNLRICYF